MTGPELIAWRAAHNLTQAQLGGALDVTKMTVWKWEQGRNPIPHSVALALWAIDHGALQEVVHSPEG
jgi:transcriptional regulator with XRE-family HTH domain